MMMNHLTAGKAECLIDDTMGNKVKRLSEAPNTRYRTQCEPSWRAHKMPQALNAWLASPSSA